MDRHPTVTVITATFNLIKAGREKNIVQCIKSVHSQDYPSIEHLVIDGASTDGTLDLLRPYEKKGWIRIFSEPDKGIYDAMNKGIRMASGDVIGVLNSDDYYYDNQVLEDIANAFNQKDIDCVYGNLVFLDAKNKNSVIRIWKGSLYHPGAFLKGWHPAHPTFYAKRTCFEQYGVFDLQYAVSADFELMLRFLEKEQIKNTYLDRYFVKMRWGGESTGTLRNIIRGNKNILKAFKNNGLKPSRFYLIYRFAPKIWELIKHDKQSQK